MISLYEWRQSIGRRLKLWRHNLRGHWSRRELLDFIERHYKAEYSASQIEKIESGKSFPGFELILIFQDLYHVDFNAILGHGKIERHYLPDIYSYPDLIRYIEGMRNAGFREEIYMAFLCNAASNLLKAVSGVQKDSGRAELESG